MEGFDRLLPRRRHAEGVPEFGPGVLPGWDSGASGTVPGRPGQARYPELHAPVGTVGHIAGHNSREEKELDPRCFSKEEVVEEQCGFCGVGPGAHQGSSGQHLQDPATNGPDDEGDGWPRDSSSSKAGWSCQATWTLNSASSVRMLPRRNRWQCGCPTSRRPVCVGEDGRLTSPPRSSAGLAGSSMLELLADDYPRWMGIEPCDLWSCCES